MEWGNKLNTKKKILVVDDKGMNRYMLGGIFRDNYEIIEAGGGMEAIAIIDKEYDELAVILLDIIMPGIDGFGVLEHMKEQDYLNRVPVVIVTDDLLRQPRLRHLSIKWQIWSSNHLNPVSLNEE